MRLQIPQQNPALGMWSQSQEDSAAPLHGLSYSYRQAFYRL